MCPKESNAADLLQVRRVFIILMIFEAIFSWERNQNLCLSLTDEGESFVMGKELLGSGM